LSESFCCSQAPNAKVADPIPGMIVAINMYLQAYHMYMAQELNKPEVRRLDTMSRDALDKIYNILKIKYKNAHGHMCELAFLPLLQ
jgi:hypothetical protein